MNNQPVQQAQQPQVQKQQQLILPIAQDSLSRNLIYNILDPSDILEFVENTLKGRKLNNEGAWELVEGSKELMEAGINRIMRILRGHLNKYQTLANLELGDIIRMGRTIRIEICDTIYMNWEDFKNKDDKSNKPDLSSADFVVDLIDHNVFANLTRAKGGSESRLLRTVYRSHEIGSQIERTLETQQGQGNFFSNLFKKKQPPIQQQGQVY